MGQDVAARLESLARKHRECEARLDALQAQRWMSDDDRREESTLKKKKLAIKDEMERLKAGSS